MTREKGVIFVIFLQKTGAMKWSSKVAPGFETSFFFMLYLQFRWYRKFFFLQKELFFLKEKSTYVYLMHFFCLNHKSYEKLHSQGNLSICTQCSKPFLKVLFEKGKYCFEEEERGWNGNIKVADVLTLLQKGFLIS